MENDNSDVQRTLFDEGGPARHCRRCKQWKPLTEFSTSYNRQRGIHYRRHYCKPCQVAMTSDWARRNPGKARLAKRRCALREWSKDMTPERYAAMLEAQGGVCAICGKMETRLARDGQPVHLHIDHDHRTGAIRQLLCSGCNTMIGLASESREILLAAVAYLDRHGKKDGG